MKQIAVLGCGTVGSGVVEVFYKNRDSIERKAGCPLDIKWIYLRRPHPELPWQDKLCFDFDQIVSDPQVQIVVEVMGGLDPAYRFVKRCLQCGKSVVTANKELIAQKGAELLQLAHENGVKLLFEASVGGGIPIIRPLHQCLGANEIDNIEGILNGTTNFILTKMRREHSSFSEALEQAQALGYAESDPTADIDGIDACRKICILASLAFGRHVYPDQVPTQGITGVTLADVAYAESCGKKIKLLGRAIHRPDGRVCAFVAPHLVDLEDPLSGVEDVFNAITVRGNAIGDVMFYGRGAGKLPTASAVVADVIDAAKHMKTKKYLGWGPGGAEVAVPPAGVESVWYVRANAASDQVRAAFPGAVFLARPGAPEGECAFLTGTALTRGMLDQALCGLDCVCVFRVLD